MMKLNQGTSIHGEIVTLVPYEDKHVLKYHEWLNDPGLRELTGSEPLTLEQEYEMVKTWRNSEDKLTFIVEDSLSGTMIGDTNVFFKDEETFKIGEVEIMIAEPMQRGKGCGRQAICLMMLYVLENLKDVKIFEAKIKDGNDPSLRLFLSLGFTESSRSSVFQETTFIVEVTSEWRTKIRTMAGKFKTVVL